MHLPILSLVGLIPLLGAAVVFGLPDMAARATRIASMVFALGTLVAVCGVVVGYARRSGSLFSAGDFGYLETHRWIPTLGTSWAFGVDGISALLILIVAMLFPACFLAVYSEFGNRPDKMQFFLALALVLECLVLWAFLARDLMLFYMLFEAMLIPMYFMIGMAGGSKARAAATKFLMYNLAAGLIMLVAVIGVYVVGPGGDQGFLLSNLTGLRFGDAATERWLFLGVFLAFAVKAPIWPLHTWLPDAATHSTPSTAVMISAVMDKVGTFGMLVICLPLFPNASRWAAPAIVVLALISVIYGALVAMVQPDLQRLIAYTSISHFGFIVLGIFALTSTGANGSVLYMVNHGWSTAAMFLIAGMFARRWGTMRIADIRGTQRVTPVLAGVFLIAGLSAMALPGLSTFVSEFMVLAGAFQRYPIAGVVGSIGIVLSALYILWVYQRMCTGPVDTQTKARVDLRGAELWIVTPLLLMLMFFGFYSKPLVDLSNPSVQHNMQRAQLSDPPTVLEGQRP